MKLFTNFILLSCLASIITAVNFLDEYDLLSFLKSIKSPPACPTNEVYKICVSNCSDCVQRGECTTETCTSGCDCKSGFYRIQPNGTCEPVAKCPKPECDENEIFRDCGPVCETCDDVTCRVITCDHKCYCKEGYLRNEDGKCIPIENCTKRENCNENEEWAESGLTEEFCLQEQQNGTISTEIQNVPQCYCQEGYRRNTWGNCINETICSIISCFGVEVYQNCIPKCNTTCRNYGNPNCTEDDNCYAGCFCPRGYVMNDFRSCIPVEECSLDEEKLQEIKSVEEDKETNNNETNETTNLFLFYTLEAIRNVTAKPQILDETTDTEHFTDTEKIPTAAYVTSSTEDFQRIESTATLSEALPYPMTIVPTTPVPKAPTLQSDFKPVDTTVDAHMPILSESTPDFKPIDTKDVHTPILSESTPDFKPIDTIDVHTPILPESTPDFISIDTTVPLPLPILPASVADFKPIDTAVHTPFLPESIPDFKLKEIMETVPLTTLELKQIDITAAVPTATPEIEPTQTTPKCSSENTRR